MFRDIGTVEEHEVLNAPICIVGAGVAGITLARRLASAGRRVLLLEGGFAEYNPASQSLYDIDSVGGTYDALGTRVRTLGGTSYHWAGQCRPLDAVDFAQRDWVAGSGWPIRHSELVPFYEQAHGILELGPFEYSLPYWREHELTSIDVTPGFETILFQMSPPVRFAQKYGEELRQSQNIELITQANVVELVPDENNRTIRSLKARKYDGSEFSVVSPVIVLACGGIENARLLLASTSVDETGIGNAFDNVGRYFADHPHYVLGDIVYARRLSGIQFQDAEFSTSAPFGYQEVMGQRFAKAWRLTDEWQRRLETTNFSIDSRPSGYGQLGDHWMPLQDFHTALFRGRHEGPRPVGSLFAYFEMTPNRDSRIMLTSEVDKLGMRKAVVDYRISDLDLAKASQATALFVRSLTARGIGLVHLRPAYADGGYLDIENWRNFDVVPGAHHMGTTRMSDNPRTGVVDKNGRIHGVTNLYVAGSSVWPTYGISNPTLTIVAMALRLGEHLIEQT